MSSATLRRVSAALVLAAFPGGANAADPPCSAGYTPALIGNIATGKNPHGVAVADFNGDGILDLATANSSASSVSVFLGSGNRAFGPGVSYPVTGSPFHVVARDFDGDGYVDLLVASYGSSVVSLLSGLGSGGVGSGSFAPAITYPAGVNPTFALDADFNRDGRPDLAVLNLTEGKVSVLLGEPPTGPGQGVFSEPVSYVVGSNFSYPATAVAGDLNGDGILDLAIALYGANQLAILAGAGSGGTGDGTFLVPTYIAGEHGPWNVVARDFNGDGVLDLAASDSLGLGILIGNGSGGKGNGSFLPPVHYGTPAYPQGMALGDFDGDGVTDVVVGLISASYLEFFPGIGSMGAGNGTFGPGVLIGTQIQPFALAAADFSSDGHPDLFVANYGADVVTLYLDSCRGPATNPYVGEWTPQGEPLFVGPGDQTQPAALADGSGGAFVAWRDTRSGTSIYATRIGAGGHPVPGWPSGGIPVCSGSGDRFSPAIASDGAGGVFIGWLDTRDGGTTTTYVQRRLASGDIAPGAWPENGLRVCPAGIQGSFTMDADGLGGVLLADLESRGSQYAIYAFRMTGGGTYPSGWTNLGRQVKDLTNFQAGVAVTSGPTMFGDGKGLGYVASAWSNPPGLDHYPADYANSLFRITASDMIAVVNNDYGGTGGNTPASCADGAGGVIFGFRSGAIEQFVDVDPANAVRWSSTLPLAMPYLAAPDGSGGVVLGANVSGGQSILGFRIAGAGGMPPGWNAGGVVVSAATGERSLEAIAPDGNGGCYFEWKDRRFGRDDSYAFHLTGSGSPAPGWASSGSPVAAPVGARDRATMIADGQGGAIVVWSDARNGSRDLFAQRIRSDFPTPALASLYRADSQPDHVRLVWITLEANLEFRIDRRDRNTDWTQVATIPADGTGHIVFEDHDVAPGTRYGYRISIAGRTPETFMGETWVEIPSIFALELDAPRPNPVVRDLDVGVVLTNARPAELELFDIAGRVVLSRQVGTLGPGRHLVHVADRGLIDPGVHFLRLSQGGEERYAKVVVVR